MGLQRLLSQYTNDILLYASNARLTHYETAFDQSTDDLLATLVSRNYMRDSAVNTCVVPQRITRLR